MMEPSSIDPNTLVGAGLVALASKDMLNRLLGPTADYIGEKLEGLVKKCDINLGRIFTHAVKKLGPKIDEPGVVNPRVLKQVWSEGAFVEDELAAEYFGGLLASARTPDGKDDRVLSLLSTVRDLSVYDLRLHYLIYSLVRVEGIRLIKRRLPLATTIPLRDVTVHISFCQYAATIGLQKDDSVTREFTDQSFSILDRYGLVGAHTPVPYNSPLGTLQEHPEMGIDVSPSSYGTKLFLWAHGHSDKRIDQVFDPTIDLPTSADIPVVPHTQ